MSVFSELKRRQVFRVSAAYLVTAWLAIQVVETILPAFGFGSAAVRAVTLVFAIGFIPTLCVAWAFAMPRQGVLGQGVVRQADPDDETATAPAAKWLDRGIIGVLALAVALLALDKLVLSAGREAAMAQRAQSEQAVAGHSIAVLPFLNMSEDPANEYFADGIAEELLNLLARVPQLRVISRSSAFSYKGKDLKIGRIAAELNVSHVLEGSVRKSGSRVRVTAQLIDARTDTHVWSQTWDRTFDDIFVIQDELAARVVSQLRLALLGDTPRVPASDPDAFALFLQARHLGRLGSAEGYAQAITLLQQVTATDPRYPPAWDALAGNYLNQVGKGLRPLDEGVALARESAEKALTIDAEFGPAHARLGWIAALHDGNLALAARHYQRALELEPTNERIIGNAAGLLKSLGRLQACIAMDEWTAARDPINPAGHFNLGGSYLYAGRRDEAIASFRTALRLSPDRIGAHFHVGTALLLENDPAAALESMRREPLQVLRLLGEAMAHHAAGRQDAADRAQQELVERHGQDGSYNIAYLLAYRGDADGAFAWLEKAVTLQDPGLADIAVEPLFENLRQDRRWLPFLHSVGRAPAQLDAIAFDVKIPT